jgi:hypothetical protein
VEIIEEGNETENEEFDQGGGYVTEDYEDE